MITTLLLGQVNKKAAANDKEPGISLHLEAKEERSEFGFVLKELGMYGSL